VWGPSPDREDTQRKENKEEVGKRKDEREKRDADRGVSKKGKTTSVKPSSEQA